ARSCLGKRVPAEAQLAQHLDMALGLLCHQSSRHTPCAEIRSRRHTPCAGIRIRSVRTTFADICRADAENACPAAEPADPQAVALEIAAARMPEAAGMRVDDAEHRESFVALADDAAGQGLRAAVELDVSNA